MRSRRAAELADGVVPANGASDLHDAFAIRYRAL
jgi:hypothetical protein